MSGKKNRVKEKRVQRLRVYYSYSSAVLIRAGDIELNPGPSQISTHNEIPVLVTARRAICKELTPSRTIENLIPIYHNVAQNRSLISTLPLILVLMNVRSIMSKSASFIEYVRDSDADLIALTETWLTVDDTAASLEIVPNGYKLINHPRVKCKGGRIALLHTDNFSVMNIKRVEESSFEISELSIKFEYLSFTIFDQPFSHG
jgi:hypothetical protein